MKGKDQFPPVNIELAVFTLVWYDFALCVKSAVVILNVNKIL